MYLDEEEVASGIMEETYTFINVPGGAHTAGVKAVYTSGSSEIVEISFTVGIEDNISAQKVVLYPNPATNVLTISRESTSNATVEVYSNNGVIVNSFEMNEAIKEISVSDLNSGIYFIRIIENETISIQKFIKQ